MHRVGYKSGTVEECATQKPTMSRYIVLLGLLAVIGAVYGGDKKVRCGSNEKLDICGKICEPSCDNLDPVRKWCPAIECSKFTTDCRCNEGYVRSRTNGPCVLKKSCGKNKQ